MSKPKLSMVSYINAKPFQLGLELSGMIDEIELHLDVPSVSARKLLNNEVDIALIPVAVLPQLEHPHIITDYCIGTTGKVASVGLFAEKPITDIQQVYLDNQSRTSAGLLKILVQEFWKKEIEFLPAFPGYESQISGVKGGLIIGDRAIKLRNNYKYFYDLGACWENLTQLPFVFATWVCNREIEPELEQKLNHAFQLGVSKKMNLVHVYQKEFGSGFNVQDYFSQNISYELDPLKYKALDLYLSKLKALKSATV